jgi:hypothetical protein
MYAKKMVGEMLSDGLSGLPAKLAEAVNAAVDGVLRKGHRAKPGFSRYPVCS